MRIAFMGTPDFAVPTLEALIAAGHEIPVVYTQPARPAGRGKAQRPSPVQLAAEKAGLPVRSPRSLRDSEEQSAFEALNLDLAVVAAYGLILPEPILAAPKGGCVNIHASVLPRWRGAAPIQRAILAGDDQTGITIMVMEKGLDTGPMLAIRSTGIDRKSAGELTDELSRLGAELLGEVLARWPEVDPRPQRDEEATYAPKITKEEARIDFRAGAEQVERQIRAFNPVPGAWFEYRGERIKLLRAEISDLAGQPGKVLDHGLTIACGDRSIVPTEVQRAGRAAMRPDELLRGFAIPVGAQLNG
jgi:methionyl-tRNA formyltransferase